jgi:hypothetical protein
MCAERPWFAPRSGRGDGRKVCTVTHAYREGHSTSTAFTQMTDDWLREIDDEKIVGLFCWTSVWL